MPTIDWRAKSTDRYDVPANWAAVTPHDTNALSDGTNNIVTKCLLIGGTTGNVRVKTAGGQTVTLPGLVSGSVYWGAFTHVLSTSTTATSIMMGW